MGCVLWWLIRKRGDGTDGGSGRGGCVGCGGGGAGREGVEVDAAFNRMRAPPKSIGGWGGARAAMYVVEKKVRTRSMTLLGRCALRADAAFRCMDWRRARTS